MAKKLVIAAVTTNIRNTEHAIAIVNYHLRRNTTAYMSHSKKKVGLLNNFKIQFQ
jgi:hypothetical protein